MSEAAGFFVANEQHPEVALGISPARAEWGAGELQAGPGEPGSAECHDDLPDADAWEVNACSAAFLPAIHQGTPIGGFGIPSERALIPFIRNADATPPELQRLKLDEVRARNQSQLALTGPDAALEGRINAFELAFPMQAMANPLPPGVDRP